MKQSDPPIPIPYTSGPENNLGESFTNPFGGWGSSVLSN